MLINALKVFLQERKFTDYI